MKLRRFYTAVCALCCAALFWLPGRATSSDPVITLAYLNNFIIPETVSQVIDRAAWDQLVGHYADMLLNLVAEAGGPDAALTAAVTEQVWQQFPAIPVTSDAYVTVTIQQGDTMIGGIGTSFLLLEGEAAFVGKSVVNVHTGLEASAGQPAEPVRRYLVAEQDDSGVTALSETATFWVRGVRSIRPAYKPRYTAEADQLFGMGLFRGSNNGYELARTATRLEGVIMLIRLLGEEAAALTYPPNHPFPDVPLWPDQMADRYVAYAYDKGYTRGTMLNGVPLFGSNDPLTADQYATFVLRALGYSDVLGDFAWDRAVDFAAFAGLAEPSQVQSLRRTFYRDHVVYLSYRALSVYCKDSPFTLGERLFWY